MTVQVRSWGLVDSLWLQLKAHFDLDTLLAFLQRGSERRSRVFCFLIEHIKKVLELLMFLEVK